MSKQSKKTLVPKLRFPGFQGSGEWEEKTLGDIVQFTGGGTPRKNNSAYWKGEIPWISSSNISEDSIHQIKISRFITKEAIKESATKLVPENSILLVSRVGVGKLAISNKPICTSQDFTNLTPYEDNLVFLAYYLKSHKKTFLDFNQGMAIKGFTKDDIAKLKLFLSCPKEQQKIADCLSSIDDLITAQAQKIESLKAHKKGLMQQLFPAEGETVPKFRFPEFRDTGEWGEKDLNDCLDYIQPSKFLVKSTAYNDSYITPVLTAGKTFILGYTNESHGIFSNKLPVIIFDDFTTATKFVDFPFKAKSSAMKILLARTDTNIKFIYEAIQMIKYEVGVHERHWISKFSKLNIAIPATIEQQKIADCLSSIDDLITAQAQKIESLKAHKKGLMQQLFPTIDEAEA